MSAPPPAPIDSKIFARRSDPLFPDVHLGHEPTSSNTGNLLETSSCQN